MPETVATTPELEPVEPVLVDGLLEVGGVTAEGTVVLVVVSEPTVPSA